MVRASHRKNSTSGETIETRNDVHVPGALLTIPTRPRCMNTTRCTAPAGPNHVHREEQIQSCPMFLFEIANVMSASAPDIFQTTNGQ